MFSSFRNAIDNLAQLPKETQAVRRGSDPLAPSDGREPPSRTASLDMSRSQSTPLSSSQLAESALSNLRKSLASNHTANPGPGPRTPSMTTSASDSAIRPAKSRLEDRLRAKLAAADASSRGSTTPVSPTSTPSPHEVQSPSTSEPPSSDPKTEAESVGSQAKVDEEVDSRHPEADIPLPQDAVDTPENVASQDSEPLPSSESPAPESPSIPPQSQSTDSQTPSVEASEPATDEPTEDSVPDSPPHNPTADPPHPLEPTGAIEEPNPAVVDATPVSKVETSEDPPVDVAESRPHDQSVDELQEQLRAFEKRFADVTESFKKLQAERDAADRVLRDASPLEGLQDVDGFRDYLQNMTLKVEMAEDEIKRLNGKLTRQDDRIEELRDTHRLESHSQSDQIERLRQQVQETDALFKASQDAITKHEDQSSELRAEIEKLKSDLERSQVVAKEEEEKRVKAISLLKTVRQKLVKAEKEKEESQKEAAALLEREKGGKDKDEAERHRLLKEVDDARLERDRAVAELRAQSERDLANLKDSYEKELLALRGQFELEAATIKNTHSRELATKDTQIATLENSVNNLSNDKNNFFEQMQLRQAENESLQSHLESLQSQNSELQYQLREANERSALLAENLNDVRREQEATSIVPSTSAEEVARLLSNTQSKYEVKLADLRKDLLLAERERGDAEAEWSRKLREKTREADDLRTRLVLSTRTREEDTETVSGLKEQIERLELDIQNYRQQIADLQRRSKAGTDVEDNLKSTIAQLKARITSLEHSAEESKTREAQLKASNKTIREELRKVQSSAALLERQRNPGVGYWSRQDAPADGRSSSSSLPEAPSRTSSPAPVKSDEEVNLEYLRNVILQFLEHKEMRPSLVKVLSIILHFTPQETRRLIAKI